MSTEAETRAALSWALSSEGRGCTLEAALSEAAGFVWHEDMEMLISTLPGEAVVAVWLGEPHPLFAGRALFVTIHDDGARAELERIVPAAAVAAVAQSGGGCA